MKLTQEIFAAGKWNGFPFTVDDLHKMAASFKKLKDYLKVPLKIGHNDEQPMTDGKPALGWVTDLAVDEKSTPPKLVATFEDIPEIVHNAMTKKLYRTVSIELDFDVKHKSDQYDYVVTAVALLGADLPAVNVLNDLASYMSARQPGAGAYSAGRQLSFSTVYGSIQETTDMTPEEMKAELAKKDAELAAANAKFTALEINSKSETEALKAQFSALQDQLKRDQVTAARAKFTAILEDAVKAKSITPAQREAFSAALRIDNDDEVLKLKEETVKALFSNAAKPHGEDHGMHGNDQDGNDVRADHALVQKTNEYMARTGEGDFSKAMFSVMRAEPALARDYVMSNGEVN
jgi:hypothetical protein